MWTYLLSKFLSSFIKTGGLRVIFPDGQEQQYGSDCENIVQINIHSRGLPRKLFLNPELVLGEAYMDGSLTVANDDIYGLLEFLINNQSLQRPSWFSRKIALYRQFHRYFTQHNPLIIARNNVAHHYDLSKDFYRLFLDDDMQYSCAYFTSPDDSLETAQKSKKHHIAAKLMLEPGHRVLDIGCGWGGLGLHLAKEHGAQVTGVTLSCEQHNVALERAEKLQAGACAEFRLQDYREVTETFDRIVSVGMFEHVGIPHYSEFFSKLHGSLADDGIALLHFIGRADGPGATNPWIAKYIFPGGYSPALSEVMAAAERSGLYVTDVEVWRLHYAETLKAWRDRFEQKIDEVRKIYDERFCRMWRFYLVVSELAFRQNGHVVFQVQLAKKQDAVPLTRDYLVHSQAEEENSRRAA
jgi:cyclopropane-fatty-acyl-phospholipid synthase|tara:strand:+ start:4139 stop:5371 length:1233 start_codon:yes stop_codon:yes gene_type:complete